MKVDKCLQAVFLKGERRICSRRKSSSLTCVTLVITLCLAAFTMAGDSDSHSKPNKTMEDTTQIERATFGGGCFWCLEALFQTVDGVRSVTSGYAGGSKENPTYKEVCSGGTGHAEAVQIEYDARKVSFAKLVALFWKAHDPTTLNRQGNDVGTQYRSVIFYDGEEQKKIAEESKKKAAEFFDDPIVTQIAPLVKFYPAEQYHQDYYENNPRQPYCIYNIRPKLDKFVESK